MNERPPFRPDSRPPEEKAESRCVQADVLFAGARELRILHGGEEYRLSITRNGKLILTK
jgi:hemin uptake protein HemP